MPNMILKRLLSMLLVLVHSLPIAAWESSLPKFLKQTHNDKLHKQKMALEKAKELKQAYIEILDEIEDSMVYWESIDYHPLRFLLSRSPLHWIAGKKRSKVKKNNSEVLEAIRTTIHEHLGTLFTLCHNCSTFPTEDACKKLDRFLHEQLDNYSSVDHFKYVYFKKIRPWSQPSHLHRNWLPYTVGAVGVTALAVYAYHNQDLIKNTLIAYKDYGKNFYNDHVKGSYITLKEIFFEGNSTSLNELKDVEKNLYQLVKEYSMERLKLSEQEAIIAARKAINGDLGQIKDEIARQSKAWIKNQALGDTWRLVTIQVKAWELFVKKGWFRVYPLLILTTTYILSAMGIYAGKKVYNTVNPKKLIPAHISISLTNLHTTLNEHRYEKQVRQETIGASMYWLAKLHDLIIFVPLSEKVMFTRDLQQLQNPERNSEQKLDIINRMFATYSFLLR